VPLQDGAPPIGWPAAAAYLSLPVLLVVSQFLSQKVISPPASADPQQQSSQWILKFLPFLIGACSVLHGSVGTVAYAGVPGMVGTTNGACCLPGTRCGRTLVVVLPVQIAVALSTLMHCSVVVATRTHYVRSHRDHSSWLTCSAGYFALNVPSGLALYWFTNNLLSTAQQVYLKSSYKPAFAGGPPEVEPSSVIPPSRKKKDGKDVSGARPSGRGFADRCSEYSLRLLLP